jgi:hypothetical protein
MILDGISESRGARMMPKLFELGALWPSRSLPDWQGRQCTLAWEKCNENCWWERNEAVRGLRVSGSARNERLP